MAPTQGTPTCARCPLGQYQENEGSATCKQCDVGTYAPTEGTVRCLDCQPGFNQSNAGEAVCVACPVSSVQPNSGQSTCSLCLPGLFMNTPGQKNCLDCSSGTFQPNIGASLCLSCLPGLFQPKAGEKACLACGPGSYSDINRAANCLSCEAGFYQRNYSASSCLRCEPGRISDQSAQASCIDCKLGTSTLGVAGQTSCSDCPFQMVAPDLGSPNCTSCPPNSSPNPQSTACLCRPGWVYNSSSFTCDKCLTGALCDTIGTTYENLKTKPGWWRQNGTTKFYKCLLTEHCLGGLDSTCAANRTGPICAFCVAGYQSDAFGSDCNKCPTKGASAAVMVLILLFVISCLLFMYWLILRKDDKERKEYKDVFWTEKEQEFMEQDDFLSTSLRQRDDLYQSQTLREHRSRSSAATPRGGSEMPLMEIKPTPRASSLEPRSSERSPVAVELDDVSRDSRRTARSIAVLTDPLASVALEMDSRPGSLDEVELERTEQHIDQRDANAAPIPQSRHNRVWTMQGIRNKPNFLYKMKIMLSFFQVVTNFAFALEVPWPSGFSAFLRVFNFVNLDFIKWASVGCVVHSDYFLKWRVFVIVPFATLASLWIFYFLPTWLYVRRDMSDDQNASIVRKIQARRLVKLVVFTIFLIYPSVSSTVLKLYVCRSIAGTWYLVQDFTIKCSGTWETYAYVNILATLLYPIGIPLCFAFVLFRNQHRLLLPKIRSQFGFLYDAYEIAFWWFEILDMVYKLIMTSIIAFLPVYLQSPAALIVVLGYLDAILVARPYIRKGDDRLSLYCVVLTLLLVLVAFVLQAEHGGLDAIGDALLSVVLIGVICVLILFFVVQITSVARKIWLKRARERIGQSLATVEQTPTGKKSTFSLAALSFNVRDDHEDERDGAAPKDASDNLPELVSSLSPSLVD